jgi:NAD(P) transhydrogenase
VEFGPRVVDSDGVIELEKVPSSMVVAGAGVIGIEYASMFAALGTRVTVIDKRPTLLEFCDPEVVESLKFHLRDLAVSFRLGEEVASVEANANGTVTTLSSGKRIPAETVMYSAGRQGQTAGLDLAAAGLEADSRGRIEVGHHYRTAVPHIYAVGDVIGFPALAATSMDQGRIAAYDAFGEPVRDLTALQPIGIYTIPEISYCGRTEEELTADSVPYETGVARYRELAAGRSSATPTGCSSCSCTATPRSCSACTCSAPVRPTSSTSARRSWAAAARSTTSSTPSSTTRRCPRRTRSPRLDVTNKLRAVERFAV